MKNSDFTVDTLEFNLGEMFSSHKFSMGADEDGWLLLEAFRSITNTQLRSTILDVVSALAWQDSQMRAGRPLIVEDGQL